MDRARPLTEPPYTILLIASRDMRAAGLRATLEHEPLVQLVGEVEVPDLIPAISRLKPDGVVAINDGHDEIILSLARKIRETAPQTKLLIFSDVANYGVEIALTRLQASSFVLWEDVNPASLHWLLGATLAGGLRVGSPQAAVEIAAPPDRRRRSRDETVRFSEQERILLSGLVRGLSDEDLAREIDRDPRTVRRLFKDLQAKLGVSTRVQLAVKAMELGFGV